MTAHQATGDGDPGGLQGPQLHSGIAAVIAIEGIGGDGLAALRGSPGSLGGLIVVQTVGQVVAVSKLIGVAGVGGQEVPDLGGVQSAPSSTRT